MNSTNLILIIVFLIAIPTINSRKFIANRNRKMRAKRKLKGDFFNMSEMINRFIGKDCMIYCGNSFSECVDGIIEEVTDEWVCVKSKTGSTQIVKIEYISRIREYPLNSKGKRASIFS